LPKWHGHDDSRFSARASRWNAAFGETNRAPPPAPSANRWSIELRIKVTAPPVDAAANEALVQLLADELDCARGRVELIRGHKSRHKAVKLHGFAPEEVLKKLLAGAASSTP